MYTDLRRIVNNGFCGRHLSEAPKTDLTRLHAALDGALVNGDIGRVAEGKMAVGEVIRRAPLSCRGDMEKLADNLIGLWPELKKYGIRRKRTKLPSSNHEVQFLQARDGDTYVEVYYHFVEEDHHFPIYAMCSAYLDGFKEKLMKVRTYSAAGNFKFEFQYERVKKGKMQRLFESVFGDKMKGGPHCVGCAIPGCTFSEPFAQLFFRWMEAKRNEEALKEEIRHHLTYNGPQQVGTHKAYLKDKIRYHYKKLDLPAILAQIKASLPRGHADFLSVTPAAVVEAVKRGVLPQSIMTHFKEKHHFEIDTIYSPI